MRYCQRTLLALVAAFLFSSCGDNKPAAAEAPEAAIPEAAAPARENALEKPAEGKQNDHVPKPTRVTAACEEKEETNPESADPILIKTCTYRNYRSISTATPDDKGRYAYENSLYRLEKGEYKEIANSDLFNQKQDDLLKQVNQRIREDYLKLSQHPDNKECLEGAEPIHDFKMDELGIGFEPDRLVFHAEFGLPGACLSVDGTSVAFKLQEVEQYLRK